jgi:hypothetical protein
MQSGRHLHFWRILILVMFFVATEDRFWNAVTQHQSIWSVLEAQKEDAIREQEANPGHVWGITENDEDAKQITSFFKDIPAAYKNADGSMTCISPSGKIITVPSNTATVSFSTADPYYIEKVNRSTTILRWIMAKITLTAKQIQALFTNVKHALQKSILMHYQMLLLHYLFLQQL